MCHYPLDMLQAILIATKLQSEADNTDCPAHAVQPAASRLYTRVAPGHQQGILQEPPTRKVMQSASSMVCRESMDMP